MNTPPPLPPSRSIISGHNTTLLKMIGIILLSLFLLIPLHMINGVLDERLQRRNESINDITSTWGREQIIVGPVLRVPYRYYFKGWKEQTVKGKYEKIEVIESAVAHAFFLPSHLTIEGQLDPTTLHRGIYKTAVYRANLKISGKFSRPDFKMFKVEEKDVLWDDAMVAVAVTDLRGVRQALQLQWGNEMVALNPGTQLDGFPSGLNASVAGLGAVKGSIPFSLDITVNGSGGIHFAPLGTETDARITSVWADPKFSGTFLPQERKVTREGFNATWQISFYGRDYPQQWRTQGGDAVKFTPENANASLFGVALVTPVDTYRNVERSIKYGILFIALVFTTFFLFEILGHTRVHPLQYVLVGAALCLFYLFLLSLSEFVRFSAAYASAALASILLVSLYSMSVLKSGRRAALIFTKLTMIYGFLYVALQMQDYSLLFGSIGLLITLAIVMFATRKLDLYAVDLPATSPNAT